jgi:hypothetical protein
LFPAWRPAAGECGRHIRHRQPVFRERRDAGLLLGCGVVEVEQIERAIRVLADEYRRVETRAG